MLSFVMLIIVDLALDNHEVHATTCAINIFGVPDDFLEQINSSINSYTLDVDTLNILPVFDMPDEEVDRPRLSPQLTWLLPI